MHAPTRIALALSLALSAGAAHANDKVTIGIVNAVSDGTLFIAQDKGYFAKEGIDADFVEFDTGAKMVAPMGAGQLDVGGGAASAGGPGPSALPASSVLGQITGSASPGASAAGGAGVTGGGGAKSAAPPASIGGGSAGIGGATDFNALPWMQNMAQTAAAPGTPAAGL